MSPSPSEKHVDRVNKSTVGLILQSENYVVGQAIAGAITLLQPLDRFVYVLSVLERYSDRECSVLLHSGVAEIARARERSLLEVAAFLTNVDFREFERRIGEGLEHRREAITTRSACGVFGISREVRALGIRAADRNREE
jgi:hypothetical protein